MIKRSSWSRKRGNGFKVEGLLCFKTKGLRRNKCDGATAGGHANAAGLSWGPAAARTVCVCVPATYY